MTKPAITKRAVKGTALTYSELDTNFQNLADATISVTDGTNTHAFNLNDTITFTAGTNITLGVNPTTGAITINSSNVLSDRLTDNGQSLIFNYNTGDSNPTLTSSNALSITSTSSVSLQSNLVYLQASSGTSNIVNITAGNYSNPGQLQLSCPYGNVTVGHNTSTGFVLIGQSGNQGVIKGGAGLKLVNSYDPESTRNVLSITFDDIPSGNITIKPSSSGKIIIGTKGQLFDDGNVHFHSTSGNLWLNSPNGSTVQICTQTGDGVALGGTTYMNSGYGSVAPVYGVRAWISCGWNGTNMVTTGSGNLSVSRSSTEIYVFTFGTAMPDGNYCINATARTPGSNSDISVNIAYNTATSAYTFTLATARYGNGFQDVPQLTVSVIR